MEGNTEYCAVCPCQCCGIEYRIPRKYCQHCPNTAVLGAEYMARLLHRVEGRCPLSSAWLLHRVGGSPCGAQGAPAGATEDKAMDRARARWGYLLRLDRQRPCPHSSLSALWFRHLGIRRGSDIPGASRARLTPPPVGGMVEALQEKWQRGTKRC